jgi:hypothetical protein
VPQASAKGGRQEYEILGRKQETGPHTLPVFLLCAAVLPAKAAICFGSQNPSHVRIPWHVPIQDPIIPIESNESNESTATATPAEVPRSIAVLLINKWLSAICC